MGPRCISEKTMRGLRAEQVFYFSKKMFDYMCEKGTAERICQESIKEQLQRTNSCLHFNKSYNGLDVSMTACLHMQRVKC